MTEQRFWKAGYAAAKAECDRDLARLTTALKDAERENERLREAVNLALMHLEDSRAIAAVRQALQEPAQDADNPWTHEERLAEGDD